MITRDFAERTRLRITEMRAIIAKLRETNKEAIRQLTKIDKQHDADRAKVYDRLGQLAEDVTDKLPEEAADADVDRAYALQEQVNDVAADVEETSLAGSYLGDLPGQLKDAFDEIYGSLKSAEAQITKVERAGAKLSI